MDITNGRSCLHNNDVYENKISAAVVQTPHVLLLLHWNCSGKCLVTSQMSP